MKLSILPSKISLYKYTFGVLLSGFFFIFIGYILYIINQKFTFSVYLFLGLGLLLLQAFSKKELLIDKATNSFIIKTRNIFSSYKEIIPLRDISYFVIYFKEEYSRNSYRKQYSPNLGVVYTNTYRKEVLKHIWYLNGYSQYTPKDPNNSPTKGLYNISKIEQFMSYSGKNLLIKDYEELKTINETTFDNTSLGKKVK